MTEPKAPPEQALAELRALGAAQLQPLRFGYLQALHRRAQAHTGVARQMLDAKLAAALADCHARLAPAVVAQAAPSAARPRGFSSTEAAPCEAPNSPPRRPPPSPQLSPQLSPPPSPSPSPAPSPLASLLTALRADAPAAAPDQAKTPQDLKVLRHFRGSWARLRLDQQLKRSLARVPDNAGPLNTQRLLLQALGVMRELSPEYLQHLMAQVEALRWIEQTATADALAARPVPAAGAAVRRKR